MGTFILAGCWGFVAGAALAPGTPAEPEISFAVGGTCGLAVGTSVAASRSSGIILATALAGGIGFSVDSFAILSLSGIDLWMASAIAPTTRFWLQVGVGIVLALLGMSMQFSRTAPEEDREPSGAPEAADRGTVAAPARPPGTGGHEVQNS